MMNKQYYVEIRPTKFRIEKVSLAPIEQANEHYGFRSVYAFDEDVVADINHHRNTRVLNNHELYSDTLFLDFDEDVKPARKFREYLKQNNINHETYHSGGRSYHFHIPLAQPMIGKAIPATQRQWVLDHAPGADVSFYRAAGMYRLPGTFHTKTGKPKILLESYTQGINLTINTKLKVEMPRPTASVLNDEYDHNAILASHLTTDVYKGGRSNHCWSILKQCAALGYDPQDALLTAQIWVNSLCYPPLSEEDILKQMQGVPEYRGGV